MYVVRNDLSMFATIRSNIAAANEKVRRSDLTQVLIAVSMPPRIARGFSFRASSKANVIICSQPEPKGTMTLSILVLSKLDNVCSAEMTSGCAETQKKAGLSQYCYRHFSLWEILAPFCDGCIHNNPDLFLQN